jgi:transposase
MIGPGFLDGAARRALIALMKNGKAESAVTRRANTIILPDDGLSCEKVAGVLHLDDGTVRDRHRVWGAKGIRGLNDFGYKGGACELTAAQQDTLKVRVAETLPRPAARIGAWIEQEFDAGYTRSAMIKVMHRIGMEFKKPKAVSGTLDAAKQQAFIEMVQQTAERFTG